MKSFEERLKTISIEKLKEFLEKNKSPCYESELLKIAFQDNDIMRGDNLSLYQNHFVLFYTLYKLQDEYYKQNKYLYVHFMRTCLLDYPEKGLCRYYNEDSGRFCCEKTSFDSLYCDFHLEKFGDKEIDTLSIKYFYYDIQNYNRLDKDTVELFINGTWEILSKYNDIKESFKIMELPECYDIELIKKQFKILAKKYHPDMGEQSHKKFNEINRSYRFLLKVISFMNNKGS